MAVKVVFNGEDGVKRYDDADGATFTYAFGPAGILYVVARVDNPAYGEVFDVYGPTAWFKVSGDIHDDGTLTRLGNPLPRP